VTAVLVVIRLVIIEFPFKISAVPKEGPIEVLASYRPDQSLNERMGKRCTGNGVDLINFQYTKIRTPPMKAKQWIVI
jgi:hypothetical protein